MCRGNLSLDRDVLDDDLLIMVQFWSDIDLQQAVNLRPARKISVTFIRKKPAHDAKGGDSFVTPFRHLNPFPQ